MLRRSHHRNFSRKDYQSRICRSAFLRSKFFVQRLGVLKVGGVEALCEPAVDLGEHPVRLVAFSLLREQPRETGRRAQFEESGRLAPGDVDSGAKTALRLCLVGWFTHQ